MKTILVGRVAPRAPSNVNGTFNQKTTVEPTQERWGPLSPAGRERNHRVQFTTNVRAYPLSSKDAHPSPTFD